MRLERTAAVVLRQFYLLRGSLARVLPLFAWVAVDIVLWGFLTRYLNTVAAPGFDFVPALLGAVVLRFGPASEWFVWPFPALVSPFAGVFYPLSTLPPWMRLVGRALPPSYVFEGMRAIISGGAASWTSLGW